MLHLFKKRTFSEYIGDTFAFFKENGKHFFKHYFIINGGLLLLLLVLSYFIFKVYFEVLFSSIGTNAPNFLEDYFNNNIALIIGVFLFFLIVILFVSLVNYAFPIIYLQLYEKHKGCNFETLDLIKAMKAKIGKIILFFLALVGLSLTAGLLLMAIVFALFFVIIGIPIAIIGIPALMAWVQLSFYEYLNEDMGILEAYGRGFDKLKQQFWPIVGSTIIMYIIIQTIATVFIAIPYIIGVIDMVTNIENQQTDADALSFFSIMMVVVVCISILVSYILNNIMIINGGIIYYSLRDQNENITTLSDIDQIGTPSE
ncbi:hypothetical protein [Flavobacterium sp.]|uniref:hypothetical protein n=1 Tax=Flavobacterium sp. TaxID=239 RepID=UPI0025C364E5|nr:hypothetical protein [Flavobacterium sp.]MBA4155247.1 hypothetical protein [Flavobacterium sp.]